MTSLDIDSGSINTMSRLGRASFNVAHKQVIEDNAPSHLYTPRSSTPNHIGSLHEPLTPTAPRANKMMSSDPQPPGADARSRSRAGTETGTGNIRLRSKPAGSLPPIRATAAHAASDAARGPSSGTQDLLSPPPTALAKELLYRQVKTSMVAKARSGRSLLSAPERSPLATPRPSQLSAGRPTTPVSTLSTSSPPPADLVWSGEAPKRFCSLSGARTVTEKDVANMYLLFCECQAISHGDVSEETIKRFIHKRRNIVGSQALIELAAMVSSALRHSKQQYLSGIQLKDMFLATYPRALAHEIKFLVDAAPSATNDAMTARRKALPMKALAHKELVTIFEIYDLLLAGTNAESMTVGRALERLEALFPMPVAAAERLRKQALNVVQDGPSATIEREKFAAFLSTNQASDIALDLDTVKSALLGADVVLGRYLRKNEEVADHEVKEELMNARPQQTFLNRVFGRFGNAKPLKRDTRA